MHILMPSIETKKDHVWVMHVTKLEAQQLGALADVQNMSKGAVMRAAVQWYIRSLDTDVLHRYKHRLAKMQE